jgi:hypothetical protein
MLQTYSVGKRVRVCQMLPRAGSERMKRTCPVRDILSEASTVTDGALSRERSGFYRCGFATLGLKVRLYEMCKEPRPFGRGFVVSPSF